MLITNVPLRRAGVTRRPLLGLLATLLLATACQSGAATSGAGGADPASHAAPETTTTPEASEGDAPPEHSPLAVVMGETTERAEGTFRAEFAAVEELVAACMAEEGFAYEPRTLPAGDEDGTSELAPDEFASEFGFGFTTLEGDGASRAETPEDPNEAKVAEMSEAERAAWDEALWGPAPEPGVDGGPAEQPEVGGCFDAATEEVHGPDTYDADAAEAFEPLMEEIGSLHDQVRRDPRVVESREAYGACMADAGHPGHSLDGEDGPRPQEAVIERLEAVAAQSPAGDGGTGEASGRSIGGVDLEDLDPEALAEVRAFEIELAVADEACRRDHEQLLQRVTFEYEEEFVESHRAELEAYRDAVHGGGGQS